ncbi:MAG: hypothetical protein R3A79_17480 [Nannocystaceae bacterium]
MTRTTAPETLYGARSHDSALFSVAAIARVGEKPPEAPRGDSSGFIDVRAAAASAAVDETPSLLRMQTTPHVTCRPRRGGLYVAAASLAMALVSSLTALAAPADRAPAHSDDVVSDYSFELEDAASSILDEPFDDGVVILAVDDDEDDELPPPAAPEVEEEPAPAKAKAPRKASKTTSASKAKASASKAKATPAKATPAPTPAPEPVASGPDPMSVDCLLSPSRCKAPEAPAPAPEPEKPRVSLPEKLSATALKAGIAAPKDRAEARCASLASAGDKVQVKLSIRGSTGAVISSAAQGGDAELGACVARELQASTFERFSAPQQGLLVTVRF